MEYKYRTEKELEDNLGKKIKYLGVGNLEQSGILEKGREKYWVNHYKATTVKIKFEHEEVINDSTASK
jgi:hypothetical protein